LASVRIRPKNGVEKEIISNKTRDISLKGLYCVTDSVLEKGTKCDIELHLSGASSDIFIHMEAEVARIGNDGMGLKFTSIDIDSFYHLKNILYYNSGMPDEIKKEITGLKQ
jgi:hypothetical protein